MKVLMESVLLALGTVSYIMTYGTESAAMRKTSAGLAKFLFALATAFAICGLC